MTRGPGAEACPAADELSARVDRIRATPAAGLPPHASTAPPESSWQASYRVEFSRQSELLTATLRAAASELSVRTLTVRGTSCEPLAQATAVTLALLRDSDAEALAAARERTERVPDMEPSTSESTPARAAAAPTRTSEPSWRGVFGLGAGALSGVLRVASPALLADVGVERGRFSAEIGALWLPAQQTELSPGSLRQWLLGGSAQARAALHDARALRLDLCAGVYAGVVDVRASGYTENGQQKRFWLALPLGLALAYRPGPVGAELGLSAILPVRRADFSIDGIGKAYHSWPVAALVSLKLLAGWPSFSKKQ